MWKWMASLLVYRGNHQCMMHFLGKEKSWECSRCGRFFPIPKSLTGASESFTPKGRAGLTSGCTHHNASTTPNRNRGIRMDPEALRIATPRGLDRCVRPDEFL